MNFAGLEEVVAPAPEAAARTPAKQKGALLKLLTCGSAAVSWAARAAGVSPIAARAIAHPINFIVTPIGSVGRRSPPVTAGPEIGGLIGRTSRSLKPVF